MKNLKKAVAMLVISAMVLGAAACGKSSGSGNTISVMLGTNVMSLDTNLATDGDSFEVIADCIDGLTQMDS